MGRPSFPKSIVEFQERFASEEACRAFLFESRWQEGFVCPRCSARKAFEMRHRPLWQCAGCGLQSSVTAGTVMHATRTPLRLWFWAAYLVATHTPGISAVQLQRQLGLSRYETAWLILHKLRRAMVAPEREPLKAEVEVDETLIGGRDSERSGGRQRDGKALVAVGVEVRGRGAGRIRLKVIPNASAKSLGGFLQAHVAPGAIVHTDGWHGYDRVGSLGYEHRPLKQRWRHPDRQLILPRAHRTVANLKTWLLGTHRGVSEDHIQVYLDEFVFRHNRRRVPMAAFQTLLGLGAQHNPTTYHQIVTHEKAA